MEQLDLLDGPSRPETRSVSLAYESPTLEQARAAVRQGRDDGIVCPCCDQLVKVYRRKINAQMAMAAAWMAKRGDGDYIDMTAAPPEILRNREYSRMALWMLVEAEPGRKSNGSRRGRWRLTDLGRKFVSGEARVPQSLYVLNGKVVDASRETIAISEVDGFSLDEVWNG